MSWFTKENAVKPAAERKAVAKPPVHVSHDVEAKIGNFLCEHGRVYRRNGGRFLMHFSASSHNHDGSVDYLVRTRTHNEHGHERNHESHVRIFADGRLKLVR
jgi:hypothetical protein